MVWAMTESGAAATMCEAFQQTVTHHPGEAALRTPGATVTITWEQRGGQEVTMNHIRRIRRSAGSPAGLASLLLASITPAPTALASQLRPDPPWWLTHWALPVHLPPEPPGFFKHPPLRHQAHVHAALADGAPGWQIALITVAAAVLAAAAILLGRALAARRHPAQNRRVPPRPDPGPPRPRLAHPDRPRTRRTRHTSTPAQQGHAPPASTGSKARRRSG
jgi:hypothetical protein